MPMAGWKPCKRFGIRLVVKGVKIVLILGLRENTTLIHDEHITMYMMEMTG